MIPHPKLLSLIPIRDIHTRKVIYSKRRNFSRDVIHDLRKAYRLLFAEEGTMAERLDDVAEEFSGVDPVMDIVEFIRSDSTRAICQPNLDRAA